MFTDQLDILDTVADELIAGVRALERADVQRPEAAELVRRLEQVRERLTATSAAWLSDFEARGGPAASGQASTAAWLAHLTRERRAVSGSRAFLARKLRAMPITFGAWLAGEITESHARVLLRTRNDRTRDAFATDEADLVARARRMSADRLDRIVDIWLFHHDPDGPEPRVEDGRNRLWYSESLDGHLKGTFDLSGEAAILAKLILDEEAKRLRAEDTNLRDIDPTDPLADQDPSERAARGLLHLLELGAAAQPTQARKPLLVVHTTLDTVAGAADIDEWKADVEHAWRSAIPHRLLEHWSCDAHVARLVLSADGEVLDLGRAVRNPSLAQKRALAGRDHGCAVPGCGRPVTWSDAHHIEHWVHGGPTDLDNLVLLCRWHHTRVHTGAIRVAIDDGRPVFHLADGRMLGPPDQVDAA